jgi:hypothetical protein
MFGEQALGKVLRTSVDVGLRIGKVLQEAVA